MDLEFLDISGSSAEWEQLGFTVVDNTIWLHGTSIRWIERTADVAGDGDAAGDAADSDSVAVAGLLRWALSGKAPAMAMSSSEAFEIDGVPSVIIDQVTPRLVEHPNGTVGIDHVVLVTGSLERTCGAIEAATGAPLKRVRETDQMRQGFHRLGPAGVIVEVVERAEYGGGPATLWGVAFTAPDLESMHTALGEELLGKPKDAVQSGRQVATVRSGAGLSVPVAFMSP
jgi:hypothetical protein